MTPDIEQIRREHQRAKQEFADGDIFGKRAVREMLKRGDDALTHIDRLEAENELLKLSVTVGPLTLASHRARAEAAEATIDRLEAENKTLNEIITVSKSQRERFYEQKLEAAEARVRELESQSIRYWICMPQDYSAGIIGFDDTVTIFIESGDPGGDAGEFAQHIKDALSAWYDGAMVTLLEQ